MIVQREVYNFALAELLRTIEESELEKALAAYLKPFEAKTEKNDDMWTDFLENIDKYAVETGIKDLAENHDHYLYGTPKRT